MPGGKWQVAGDGCQITPVNVPAVYTHYDPPIYGQDVPPIYSPCSNYRETLFAN